MLQAAFRGHLARARLLSSRACVSEPPRVPSPPPQVPWGPHLDPSPLSLSPSRLTLHPPTGAGTSLAVLWLRRHLPKPGMQVQSLVGELRPPVPCGQNTENSVVTDSTKTLKLVHIQKTRQGKSGVSRPRHPALPGMCPWPCPRAPSRMELRS